MQKLFSFATSQRHPLVWLEHCQLLHNYVFCRTHALQVWYWIALRLECVIPGGSISQL